MEGVSVGIPPRGLKSAGLHRRVSSGRNPMNWLRQGREESGGGKRYASQEILKPKIEFYARRSKKPLNSMLVEEMKNFEDIRKTLSHAKLCYEAWWLFKGEHPERKKIKSVYNNYSYFFYTIHPALYCSFVIKLASLFGNRDNEISLKMLPDIEKCPGFANLWQRGRRFYKYRNQVIAHRDRQISTRNFAKETGLTYNDLRRILDDTCLLIDAFAKHNKIDGTYNFSCESDLMRLISDLFQYNN